jgi:alpha-1,2-mannosyltransferase
MPDSASVSDNSKSDNSKKEFRPSKIQFAYFSMILAWAGNVLLFFATTNPDMIMTGEGSLRLADFVGYYEAARLAAAGANLYDFNTQLTALNQIVAPAHTDIAWAIPYPPTFYLLAAPLSMLSLTDAYVFWKFVSVPIGLLGTAVLVWAQKRFSKIDRAAIMVALVANTPALLAIRAGQFSYVALALVSLYCWAFLQKRFIIAGLCLGVLGVVKPHYAIFLAIPVFILRYWKVIASAVPLAGIVGVATVARFGFHILPDYVHYLSEVYTSPNYTAISPAEQVNMRALIMYDILQMPTSSIVVAFGTVSLLIGLAAAVWLWFKSAKKPELYGWAMSVTLVLSLFCGPHVHIHDCLLLAVAAILTIPSVSPSVVMKSKDTAYRVWCMTMLLYPLVSFISFNLSIFGTAIRTYPILAQNVILTVSGILYMMRQWKQPDLSE